jgi:peptide deformylase
MIIKQATQVGNHLIRAKTKSVINIRSKKVKKLIKDLVDSMRYHDLVGMAAPQIGVGLRVFVSEIRKTKIRKGESVSKNMDALRVYINPKIIWKSKKQIWGYEGCGSVGLAKLMGKVKRPQGVVVEATDEKGKRFRLKAANLLARVIQHEMDHLNGVVFTDNANSKTFMSINEYLKKFSKK